MTWDDVLDWIGFIAIGAIAVWLAWGIIATWLISRFPDA